jgi:hypothetical protein
MRRFYLVSTFVFQLSLLIFPFPLKANQRLSDTWRTCIGSAAITILLAFFDSPDSGDTYDTDQKRQEFAEATLVDNQFLYSKVALVGDQTVIYS